MKKISMTVAMMLTLVSLVSVATANTPDASAKMRGNYGDHGVHQATHYARPGATPTTHPSAPVDSRRAYSLHTTATQPVASPPVSNAVRVPSATQYHPARAMASHDAWSQMIRNADVKMSGNY